MFRQDAKVKITNGIAKGIEKGNAAGHLKDKVVARQGFYVEKPVQQGVSESMRKAMLINGRAIRLHNLC